MYNQQKEEKLAVGNGVVWQTIMENKVCWKVYNEHTMKNSYPNYSGYEDTIDFGENSHKKAIDRNYNRKSNTGQYEGSM